MTQLTTKQRTALLYALSDNYVLMPSADDWADASAVHPTTVRSLVKRGWLACVDPDRQEYELTAEGLSLMCPPVEASTLIEAVARTSEALTGSAWTLVPDDGDDPEIVGVIDLWEHDAEVLLDDHRRHHALDLLFGAMARWLTVRGFGELGCEVSRTEVTIVRG